MGSTKKKQNLGANSYNFKTSHSDILYFKCQEKHMSWILQKKEIQLQQKSPWLYKAL